MTLGCMPYLSCAVCTQAPGKRAVWRQVLQLHLDQVLLPLYGSSKP